jgi:hypothetical protein
LPFHSSWGPNIDFGLLVGWKGSLHYFCIFYMSTIK